MTVSLMHTLVIPLLPRFPAWLDSSAVEVSWLATSTMLAGAVCAPMLGRMGDMFGRRRMLLLALGMMTVGSLLGAVSWSFESLVVARVLQGAAFGVIPLGMSILRDELPAGRSGFGIALLSSTLGIGGGIGLPLSGALAHIFDWHAVFWAASAMSAISILLAVRFVPVSRAGTGGRFDLAGAIGLSLALGTLLVAISQSGVWGWTNWRTVGAFSVAALLLTLWAAYELRARHPLVNLRLSAQPVIAVTNLAAVMIGVALFTSFVLTGQLLQAPVATGYGFGLSTMMAGLCVAPMGVGMLIFSPVSAWLSAARGAHVTLTIGALAMLVGSVVQALLVSSLALVVTAVVIMSVGTALTLSAMPTLIMNGVPAGETAAANSLNAVMRTIGTSSASAVAGSLLATFTMEIGGGVVSSGVAYTAAFGIAAACALLAVALAVLVGVVGRRAPAEATEAGRTLVAERV